MHIRSLRINGLSRRCLINTLRDEKETKNAKRKTNGDPKNISQVEQTVLSELNKFLRRVARQSSGSEFQLQFLKSEKTHNLSGLFG